MPAAGLVEHCALRGLGIDPLSIIHVDPEEFFVTGLATLFKVAHRPAGAPQVG